MSSEIVVIGAAAGWALWTVARGWPSMAAAERRLAARRVASMIGLGVIGWTMATKVDAGLTREWPREARTAWGIALLGCLFASLHAWWRLVGFADLRRAPRGSFDAPASAGERPTLAARMGAGARLTLGMGAVHGLAFFGVLAFVQRRPGLLLVGAGFVGMLALSERREGWPTTCWTRCGGGASPGAGRRTC